MVKSRGSRPGFPSAQEGGAEAPAAASHYGRTRHAGRRGSAASSRGTAAAQDPLMGDFLTLMFLLLYSWAQGTTPAPHGHSRRGHHAAAARRDRRPRAATALAKTLPSHDPAALPSPAPD